MFCQRYRRSLVELNKPSELSDRGLRMLRLATMLHIITISLRCRLAPENWWVDLVVEITDGNG